MKKEFKQEIIEFKDLVKPLGEKTIMKKYINENNKISISLSYRIITKKKFNRA